MLITAALLSLVNPQMELRRPFLSPIFSDHMVLQRGQPNRFWGWTEPGKSVRVTIGDKAAVVRAGQDGKWMAEVLPPRVGGPYQIKIVGPNTVILNDVLVGDVWICGGQSNMQYGLEATTDGAAEIAAAAHPQIRFTIVPTRMSFHPYDFTPAPWKICSPTSVKGGEWNGLSAVGYYFAREIQRKAGVPIGLVHDCRGGSAAEGWLTRSTLEKQGSMAEALGRVDAAINSGHREHGEAVEKWLEASDPGSRNDAYAKPELDDRSWSAYTVPSGQGLSDISGFAGVSWFRTEINLPATSSTDQNALHLGSIDGLDWAYVNGKRVGQTFTPGKLRTYPIPADLLHPGKNIIAIRTQTMGSSDIFESVPSALKLRASGQDWPLAKQPWRVLQGPNLWSGKGEFPWGIETAYNSPLIHYNAMIAPVAPLAVKGVIWYQGESNVGRSRQYIELMPLVASDWRQAFRAKQLPFFQVQLANYLQRSPEPRESSWAALREAQQVAASKIPMGGIVSAIDIGDPGDIHPKNKRDVGTRLARQVLKQVYGQSKEHGAGPSYASFRREGQSLRITFKDVVGGLVIKGNALSGFAVAGEDHKFHWAKATLVGNEVVLTSPEVPNPVAARYAWDDNPETTLFDQDGLPVFPFRTDQWTVY